MPVRRGHWHLQKELAVLAALDLDAPRRPGDALPPERERAGTVVVHVDRADMSMASDGIAHVGAGQLATLAGSPPGGAP